MSMMNRSEAVQRLQRAGLIEMGFAGEWEPSRKGDQTLYDLELLRQLAAARDERNTGGMMSQRTRADRRPEQGTGGAGWQKPVSPPPPGSRPTGMPPKGEKR